jgi:hypothetical protein
LVEISFKYIFNAPFPALAGEFFVDEQSEGEKVFTNMVNAALR